MTKPPGGCGTGCCSDGGPGGGGECGNWCPYFQTDPIQNVCRLWVDFSGAGAEGSSCCDDINSLLVLVAQNNPLCPIFSPTGCITDCSDLDCRWGAEIDPICAGTGSNCGDCTGFKLVSVSVCPAQTPDYWTFLVMLWSLASGGNGFCNYLLCWSETVDLGRDYLVPGDMNRTIGNGSIAQGLDFDCDKPDCGVPLNSSVTISTALVETCPTLCPTCLD